VSYVIAVAAPPGGGKTALVRALAARLGDATAIHFDAYEMATERPVAEIVQDLRAGVAFDDFANPQLAIDLAALKNGEAITPPDEGRIEPAKYILFEMPMGRAHGPTAGLIDLLLWIDIPFDIALARKLREYASIASANDEPARTSEFIIWLEGYLGNYLAGVRDTLEFQRDRIGGDADLTIDGTVEIEIAAEEAAKEIQERLP